MPSANWLRTGIDIPDGGESYEVDAAVAEMAACDDQHIGDVGGRSVETQPRPHVGAERKRATQSIPPATWRQRQSQTSPQAPT